MISKEAFQLVQRLNDLKNSEVLHLLFRVENRRKR